VSGRTPYRASRPGARAVTSGTISSSRRSSWPPGELRASSQLAQRDPGGVADGAAGAGPQRCGLGHQGDYGVAGEPGPQVVGPGHDQGPGLVDGLGPLGAGAALGDHERADRLDGAVPAFRRAAGPAGLRGPGGADGVERVGLAQVGRRRLLCGAGTARSSRLGDVTDARCRVDDGPGAWSSAHGSGPRWGSSPPPTGRDWPAPSRSPVARRRLCH
jgi:hypothetical protein